MFIGIGIVVVPEALKTDNEVDGGILTVEIPSPTCATSIA